MEIQSTTLSQTKQTELSPYSFLYKASNTRCGFELIRQLKDICKSYKILSSLAGEGCEIVDLSK